MTNQDIADLRRKALKKEFSKMNDKQLEAVFNTEGPLLILAGAGSGKTTVLINRILNIIKYGQAYNSNEIYAPINADDLQNLLDYIDDSDNLKEKVINKLAVNQAQPWQILAITFTNKAAQELKDRLSIALGETSKDIWAMTFHSMCSRILRRFAEKIGYKREFTIYDTDDKKKLLKECFAELKIDEKFIPIKSAASQISNAKDTMLSPEEYMIKNTNDYYKSKIGEIYALYQNKIKQADAMDFDDLIVNTVELLKTNSDVLELYQNQFKYIMVDEYQDTNKVQYELVKLLSSKSKNLCVVGDDDQSIYKFRGATIENILNFEDTFSNAKVIRLEQNYRSTQNILNAANEVIKHNTARKGKNLWTDAGAGEKIEEVCAYTEMEEAKAIADIIASESSKGCKYSDFAILYRMNAQSNTIEKGLNYAGIPYRIIGGSRFTDRMEVKDMLSYLNVINNPEDTIRLQRILNVPKRGIGEKTISYIKEISENIGESMFHVINNCEQYPKLSRSYKGLRQFADLINELIQISEDPNVSIKELYENVIEKSKYEEHLKLDRSTYETRMENVKELASNIVNYEKQNEEPTLEGFLEEMGLFADIDNYDEDADAVVMMTIHSAKGLEFPCVFLPGFENNIFPGNCIQSNDEELEEERRLCYVAITRAKNELHILHSKVRTIFGKTAASERSCFLDEIPENLITKTVKAKKIAPNSPMLPKQQKRKTLKPQKITPLTNSESKQAYYIGENVKHSKFGVGEIMSAKNMGGDTLLEINFDKAGSKKLMANYVHLEPIN